MDRLTELLNALDPDGAERRAEMLPTAGDIIRQKIEESKTRQAFIVERDELAKDEGK
jgi:hypothetical protein